jgi:hypothetical protein
MAWIPDDAQMYPVEGLPFAERPSACDNPDHVLRYGHRTFPDDIDGEDAWAPRMAFQAPDGHWVGVCLPCFVGDSYELRMLNILQRQRLGRN